MDLLNALDLATDEFGTRLARVTPDGWAGATPCGDWDVRYLAAHVVGGNRFAASVLRGMSASEAIEHVMSAPQLGDDPITAWTASAADQRDAFRAAGTMERRIDHPLGEITGAQFLEFRLFDVTLHSWDLARSINADEHMNPQLVDVVLGIVQHGPVGMGFGITALGDADATAPAQTRLLDLSGRR
jgi:uncharacterized protein (TIGR03086 family)